MKTLSETSFELQNRQISSTELTKKCLDKIFKENNNLGCFLHIAADSALKAAKESDTRRNNNTALGALDGIPIAVKDMIFCSNMPVTAGSKMLEEYIAPYDATVIKKLKSAGAIILGKLNQDEFAMGSSGENSAFGICKNPLDFTKTPGGSSSGSAAALAANLVYSTLGTDTGGSVRQPASFCGVVGLKPTYGRISRFGVISYASSLDQVGILGFNVKDVSIMLSKIAGYDKNDATSIQIPVPDYADLLSKNLKVRKIGIITNLFEDYLSLEANEGLKRATEILKNKGVEIIEINFNSIKMATAVYYIISTSEVFSNLARYNGIAYGQKKNKSKSLEEMYRETRGELFGAEVKRRILLGNFMLGANYYETFFIKAQKIRGLIIEEFKTAFKIVDFILTPTTPRSAFNLMEKIQNPLEMYLQDIFTIPVNLAGLPGLSIPIQANKQNMPVGIQLIGKPFDEIELLKTGYALETWIKEYK